MDSNESGAVRGPFGVNCRVFDPFEGLWTAPKQNSGQLDPVGSTVRYEMMKLCTGSVQDTMRQ